eukprot:833983-Pelagomonas_calceolata.AAC.1
MSPAGRLVVWAKAGLNRRSSALNTLIRTVGSAGMGMSMRAGKKLIKLTRTVGNWSEHRAGKGLITQIRTVGSAGIGMILYKYLCML